MFKIPPAMVGRKVAILLSGTPTLEVKVKRITEDEIVVVYPDGEDVYLNPAALIAWWALKAKKEKAK
jgi:hypothetical protein